MSKFSIIALLLISSFNLRASATTQGLPLAAQVFECFAETCYKVILWFPNLGMGDPEQFLRLQMRNSVLALEPALQTDDLELEKLSLEASE